MQLLACEGASEEQAGAWLYGRDPSLPSRAAPESTPSLLSASFPHSGVGSAFCRVYFLALRQRGAPLLFHVPEFALFWKMAFKQTKKYLILCW